jgi:hypothetical protein
MALFSTEESQSYAEKVTFCSGIKVCLQNSGIKKQNSKVSQFFSSDK